MNENKINTSVYISLNSSSFIFIGSIKKLQNDYNFSNKNNYFGVNNFFKHSFFVGRPIRICFR